MVIIKEVNKEKRVYQNRKLMGTLRKFCCGVDLRLKNNPDVLFSILGVKFGDKKLEKCIEALLSIEIPNVELHQNFDYKTATDNNLIMEYQKSLKDLVNNK